MGPGRDVHATLGDPTGLEAAGGPDVEVRDEGVDERLVGRPAGFGGRGRREEGGGEAEVGGLDEAEAPEDVAAGGVDVEAGAGGGAGYQVAENGKVKGTGCVVLGEGWRAEKGETEGEEEKAEGEAESRHGGGGGGGVAVRLAEKLRFPLVE